MAKRKPGDDGLVYSTDPDRLAARTAAPSPAVRGDGRVRVRRETGGRRGKTVTTITGLALDPSALDELARALKQACGVGGTVKEGVIELQGDRVGQVLDLLRARGLDPKQAGG